MIAPRNRMWRALIWLLVRKERARARAWAAVIEASRRQRRPGRKK